MVSGLDSIVQEAMFVSVQWDTMIKCAHACGKVCGRDHPRKYAYFLMHLELVRYPCIHLESCMLPLDGEIQKRSGPVVTDCKETIGCAWATPLCAAPSCASSSVTNSPCHIRPITTENQRRALVTCSREAAKERVAEDLSCRGFYFSDLRCDFGATAHNCSSASTR